MMSGLVFFVVDVFAEEKFAGNQLAVVLNAACLTGGQMQQIANEMHFSETSFVLSSDTPQSGGYPVRIFTPYDEVPFAGHPTLGTAYVIKHYLAKQELERVVLDLLKIGQIPGEAAFASDAKSPKRAKQHSGAGWRQSGSRCNRQTPLNLQNYLGLGQS